MSFNYIFWLFLLSAGTVGPWIFFGLDNWIGIGFIVALMTIGFATPKWGWLLIPVIYIGALVIGGMMDEQFAYAIGMSIWGIALMGGIPAVLYGILIFACFVTSRDDV